MPDEMMQFHDVTNPFTIMYLAAIAGGIVRLLKTKKVSDLLDALPPSWLGRIPKTWLPWLAVVISMAIAFGDARLNSHLSWKSSALMALAGALPGLVAVGLNETVANLFKAIIQKMIGPSSPPPNTGDDSKDSSSPLRTGFLSRRGLLPAAACLFAALMLFQTRPMPSTLNGPMILTGCSGWTKQDTKNVADIGLTVAQIACVKQSAITDEEVLADVCKIVNSSLVRDFIRLLVGEREAAKKAGFTWPGEVDAGPDASQ